MTRSRLVVFSSFVVVGLGVAAALGAFYLDPARASVGPLPGAALALPADARFVMGIDVKRFTSSPFYRKYAASKMAMRPDAFRDLEEKTGVNPERDVETIVIAGRDGAAGKDSGVVLVIGDFDQSKLGRAIETESKGKVTWKKHEGISVYLFNEATQGAGAAAFLDDHTLVLGTASAVESTITSRTNGGQPLRSNTALIALVEKIKPGSTFWMVGDQSLLKNLPKAVPAPGATAEGGGQSLNLPALKSLMVTGDLDPLVAVEVTGETADEAAARNLADIVRGFTALAALQANQRPELKELSSAISVTTEASRVRVNARLPYELLEALQPKKAAAAVSK